MPTLPDIGQSRNKIVLCLLVRRGYSTCITLEQIRVVMAINWVRKSTFDSHKVEGGGATVYNFRGDNFYGRDPDIRDEFCYIVEVIIQLLGL